jgi:hypothetical protein
MDMSRPVPAWEKVLRALLCVGVCVLLGTQATRLWTRWAVNQAMVHLAAWTMAPTVQAAHRLAPQADQSVANVLNETTAEAGTRLASHAQRLAAFQARQARHRDQLAAQDWLAEAQSLQKRGLVAEAVSTYNRVLSLNPRLIEAYAGLHSAYEAQGLTEQARSVAAQWESLAPPYRLGKSDGGGGWDAETPPVGKSGLRLLGYDLYDEEEVTHGGPIRVALYWQLPDSRWPEVRTRSQGDWQFYAVGTRLYQVGIVHNMVSNAGFEAAVTARSSQVNIPGWPGSHYSTAPYQTMDIALVTRNDLPGFALRLLNDAGGPSGKTTGSMTVDPAGLYLHGAWLCAEDGAIACVARAYDPGRAGHATPDFDYLACVRSDRTEDWMHVAGLTAPWSGAQWVRLFLTNIGSGQALFDDVLFLPLTGAVSQLAAFLDDDTG